MSECLTWFQFHSQSPDRKGCFIEQTGAVTLKFGFALFCRGAELLQLQTRDQNCDAAYGTARKSMLNKLKKRYSSCADRRMYP